MFYWNHGCSCAARTFAVSSYNCKWPCWAPNLAEVMLTLSWGIDQRSLLKIPGLYLPFQNKAAFSKLTAWPFNCWTCICGIVLQLSAACLGIKFEWDNLDAELRNQPEVFTQDSRTVFWYIDTYWDAILDCWVQLFELSLNLASMRFWPDIFIPFYICARQAQWVCP